MENIQPWCISRQLWWGHQIPAWYGPDRKVFVALSKEEATKQAITFYKKKQNLHKKLMYWTLGFLQLYGLFQHWTGPKKVMS